MIWRGQLQQAARTQYLSRTVSPLLVCIVLCYLTSVVARKVWGADGSEQHSVLASLGVPGCLWKANSRHLSNAAKPLHHKLYRADRRSESDSLET